MKRRTIAGAAALMAVNATMLGFRLGAKSIWVDEVLGVKTARARGIAAAFAHYKASEVQPPVNNVLLYVWTRLAGSSDAVVRIPSVVCAVACVPLLLLLAHRLVGRRAAWIAAYLFAISPFVLLFGRMALYYVPTLFFTLCSALTLIRALDRRTSPIWWILHAVAAVLLLLTNYTSAAYLVAETAFAALVILGKVELPGTPTQRPPRSALAGWLASTAAVVVAFGAWLATDASRLAAQGFHRARPAELLGAVRLALDAAYPLFAWTVGPTIFPWHPIGFLATIVAAAALIAGFVIVVRSRTYAFVALGSLGTLLITVLAYQVYVKGRPFETIPTRAIAAFPFVLMLVALAIDRLGRTALVGAMAVLTAAYAVGAIDYAAGRDFHNSIYTVPSRQIARTIASNAQPGDVVVAEHDTEVPYYLAANVCTVTLSFKPSDDTSALAALSAHPPARIWTVELGRDGTQDLVQSGTKDWIAAHYRVASERGYVWQNARYTAIKRRLEPGPGYRFKATVRLFDHPSMRTAPASCPIVRRASPLY